MEELVYARQFLGLHRMPCQLVSLSGGGYRAALFHAGVMRALCTANILTREGFLDRNVVITAVSGGSITAMLWEAFMAHGGDGWWPEEALLDLVTEGPVFLDLATGASSFLVIHFGIDGLCTLMTGGRGMSLPLRRFRRSPI